MLRDLEELSYREVAEITAVPMGTVMSRLARARRMLGERMGVMEAHGMSACPDKELLLHALADGELDAGNALALEAHVADLRRLRRRARRDPRGEGPAEGRAARLHRAAKPAGPSRRGADRGRDAQATAASPRPARRDLGAERDRRRDRGQPRADGHHPDRGQPAARAGRRPGPLAGGPAPGRRRRPPTATR